MGRSGIWQKNLSGAMEYESFAPSPLPPSPPLEHSAKTHDLLITAHRYLALLDGLSSRIPNVNLFISMYVRKEALMSSQIEGTQATLEDILDPSLDENANQDVADVVNYIKATKYAIQRLNDLPLCSRLIRETHAVLMENARGQEKMPGEFRRSQNWIGGSGSTLRTARYIPPAPEYMNEAMSRLEWFMNHDEQFASLDVLTRAALIHYQFETIHPFLDGNGRIGRLLVILFLVAKGVISTPVLYISYFLKRNRIEYYDRLTYVRAEGDYEQWVNFFLSAIKESAEDAIAAIDKLSALHMTNTELVACMGRSAKTLKKVFSYLEEHPIIEIKKTAAALGISFNTVASAINRLLEAGILVQTENVRRNRTFSYEAYLGILREGT
ncbi:MAG: Fic family protein [Gracilibacteraceae bacterium]|jgi:Fic family protein|nr:Fic family protein [Gracilibacteraceae bacterium]